jgi:imidazoleglycerol-phosphate dehydratase
MGDNTATIPPSIRAATVERITNETKIKATLSLDVHPTAAPQVISVKTGIGFLDHVSVTDLLRQV